MELEVVPTIIMPNKDFLVGVLYGFNAAKKLYNVSQPYTSDQQSFRIGYWLELTCAKCQRTYCYDDPNLIPSTNLICETENCKNHIIVYNVHASADWKLGSINFI